MTIRKMAGCSFAGDTVSCDYLFDDVTLLLSTVEYKNTSNLSVGALVVDDKGHQHQFVWPALGTAPNTGDGTGSTDVSNLRLTVVAHTGISNGVQITVYTPPAGWVIGFQYPAA